MVNPGFLMFRYFLAAFLIFSMHALGDEAAEASWGKAVEFLNDAENKIRKGANDEAVVLLKTSAESLTEIQYNYPKWNSTIVRNKLLAVNKRIEDVEKLILSSLSGLDKDQLLEKLKETQIAKAKFSKAMMIIYGRLKDSEEALRLKTKDLEEAQKAASQRITDQAHLDKLTFENLKMKKMLDEKNARLKLLEAKLDESDKDKGKNDMQQAYEKKMVELSKKAQTLEEDKKLYLAEKKKMSDSLKTMSLKYQEVILKETEYEGNLEKLAVEISKFKKKLAEEQAMNKKLMSASETGSDKLELAVKRMAELEAREKKLLADIAKLKKGEALSPQGMDSEQLAKLTKEINYLKKVEIDLKSKLGTSSAEAEKNKKLLDSYLAETGPARKRLKEQDTQIAALKKSMNQVKADEKVKNSQLLSMSGEVTSLKGQLKLQQTIIDSLKDRLKKNTATMDSELSVKEKADPKLLKAYEKNEQELLAKLKLTEKELAELKKRNETLKKENLLGDEEMIRKYVQVRDELKAYKDKTKELFTKMQKSERPGTIMEAAFTEDEKKELDRQNSLRDLLFRAQKEEQAEKYQSALGLYTKVLQLEPANYDALFRIGLIHYNRGHYQDAAVHLKKAFYKEPDDENLLLALGLSYLEQDKIEMAVSYLSRLVGLKPEDALARLQLGVSLQGLGWTEAAFDQLKKACELDQKNGEAAFNLAMVSLALPEPKVQFAKMNYDRAVKLGVVRDQNLEKYFEQFIKK